MKFGYAGERARPPACLVSFFTFAVSKMLGGFGCGYRMCSLTVH